MPRVVVTDTNVLVNLIHVDWLSVLGALDGYEFILVDEVLAEITHSEQKTAIQAALNQGYLSSVRLDDIEGLTLFSEFARIMGATRPVPVKNPVAPLRTEHSRASQTRRCF
ncbi:hypothetical protein MYX65_13105 [Acidobacteria bacterium AH-259-L09]|nr:hypothetical protein [Acidobacteria bacterium AH-259-L09]